MKRASFRSLLFSRDVMPMDQDMSWGVLARAVGHGGQKLLPYPLSIHEKACDFMYAFNESRIYVHTSS